MPTSHDSKPRQKHRRDKWQNEQKEMVRASAQRQRPRGFIGPVWPLSAQQTFARRLLRQHYQAAVKAQHDLELSLRAMGISWRAVEKAIRQLAGGKWKGFSEAVLKQLVEQETGMRVAA